MYNCIRMEFRKCFHSHNFIISMATCVLLALSSASYCCQGYLNIHDALDQYCFENGHMVSNELFPVWTSYNYWIGGESETLAYSAFYTLLPLFAILPHSLSCLQEKKSSYANQMVVRVGRQPYYLSKGIVCFSAAFGKSHPQRCVGWEWHPVHCAEYGTFRVPSSALSTGF